MTEGRQRMLDRLGGIMEQQRQLPEPDYSLPAYNDPARLREWMNALGINQSDLAREAHVSQQLISQIESGRPFSEPSRRKIWRAINRLQLNKIERDTKQKISEGSFDNPEASAFSFLAGLFKTPLERKDEEIAHLTREVNTLDQLVATLKQLIDINLVDRCVELEKKLADAYQQIADFHRLFALRGAAVAGDELQAQIEARQRGLKDGD